MEQVDIEAQQLYEKLLPVLNEYIKEKQDNKEKFDADMFIHILGNIIPAHIYASMEEKEIVEFNDLIDFNHIANKLLFKFSTLAQQPAQQPEEINNKKQSDEEE